MVTPHEPHLHSVLIIDADAMQRAALEHACRTAGMSVLGVSSVAEVERWPVGQIVVTDAAHLTPMWRQVGAAAVIVLVQRAEDGAHAGERGATHWLQPPPPPDVVATMVLALAAAARLPDSGSEPAG